MSSDSLASPNLKRLMTTKTLLQHPRLILLLHLHMLHLLRLCANHSVSLALHLQLLHNFSSSNWNN